MNVRHADLPLIAAVNKALTEKDIPWTFSPEPHTELDEKIQVELRPKTA